MTTRDWKFHIWKSTATSLSTTLVDFTVDNTHLVTAPVITGSRIRPLDGLTEARPWTIEVLDNSSFFTAQIGDAGGRLDLLGRFVQANLSIDGAAYAPVAGGRLVDAINADNIATWKVTVQDEWLAGANTMLFTTNTTLLYPPRPYRGYKGAAEGRAVIGTATRITGNATTTAPVFSKRRLWQVMLHPGGGGSPPLNDPGVNFIRDDLLPDAVGLSTKGSFKYLRFRYAGTDYKVVGFKSMTGVSALFTYPRPDPENHLFDEDALREHQTKGAPLVFWVAASSTAFGGAATKTFALADAVSLHAMSGPATPATPLHIWPGWSSANPWGTIHPMQVLKDCLDGVYSSSSESLPYYSTESFTGNADIRRLVGVGVAFRVTQSAPLREWVTDNLLAPHGVVAFGDYRGRVAFKSIFAANPQLGYSTANLYQFTSTNLRTPHPDWRTSRREQVTQVQVNYERVSLSVAPGAIQTAVGLATFTPPGYTLGGDGLSVKMDSTYFNHDRIQRYGTFPIIRNFAGYGTVGDYSPFNPAAPWVAAIQYQGGAYAAQVFNRYGDGPMQGTLYALPGASTLQSGDFARMTLGSYPSPAGGGVRGGTRLVQLLTRDITPEGYAYEFIDAGSAAVPAASPVLTLSSSTTNPRHALKATVSSLPSGGAVQLYMAESATTTPPGSSNAAWHPIYTSGAYGLVRATGEYQLPNLKSNTRFFVAGQSYAPNLPASQRSTPQTKVTGAIASMTGLTMSSVKAKTAGSTWVLGDSHYGIDYHLDTSTSATPTTSNRLFRLPAGTIKTPLTNLTPSQKYRSWVRHADIYGGFSGFDSTTFTMTSTATTSNTRTAPVLGGLYTVFGST